MSWLSTSLSGSHFPFVAGAIFAVTFAVLAVATVPVENQTIYKTASVPTDSAIIAVRFVAQATASDIATFLNSYKSSIVNEPRPGGFFRIRVPKPALSQEKIGAVAARMAQDSVVDMVTVSQ